MCGVWEVLWSAVADERNFWLDKWLKTNRVEWRPKNCKSKEGSKAVAAGRNNDERSEIYKY